MDNTRRKQSVELSLSEQCPCESGRKYSTCCKKRKFRWIRDRAGNIFKEQRISNEVVDALRHAEARFKTVFERKPRRDDPIFIDKYFTSTADAKRETLQALRAAQVRPEIIYAYLQTDRLVQDPKQLTPAEQAEYEGALVEFQNLIEAGASIEELIDPETPERILNASLQQVQILGGYYIEKYINSGVAKRSATSHLDMELVVSFAVVSFVKSLRSICILLENGVSYDANYLVRSLYENYLKIRYVYKDPSRASAFIAHYGDGKCSK